MGFFDPVKRKIGNIKEDMRRNAQEEDEFRRQQHLARMKSASKRAEALENARIQREIKETRKGNRRGGGFGGGLKEALGNFSEGMLSNNMGMGGMGGFNPDFMLGGNPTPRRRHKIKTKKPTKIKTKKSKKKR